MPPATIESPKKVNAPMAQLDLIHDFHRAIYYIVPFAPNPRIGNAPTACGASIQVADTELETRGVPAIKDQLLRYSTNDVEAPSEFYELLSFAERNEILSRSVVLCLAKLKRSDFIELTANVRGRNIESNVSWNATVAEIAVAIERFSRKVRLIADAGK